MTQLSALALLYVHVLDQFAMGPRAVPADLRQRLRAAFDGPAGGFAAQTAVSALQAGEADLIGFGRPFLANPDLVQRMKTGAALNTPDMNTVYTPDAKGYTDYPTLME